MVVGQSGVAIHIAVSRVEMVLKYEGERAQIRNLAAVAPTV